MNSKRDFFITWGVLIALLCAVIFVYGYNLFPRSFSGAYFLDVGQADANIIASDNVVVAVDVGRDGSVLDVFDRITPWGEKRVDMVVLSHLDRDHVGGLFHLLRVYRVGVVVWNGDKTDLYDEVLAATNTAHVPLVALYAGSVISWGSDNRMTVLWPTREYLSKKHTDNDASLIIRYEHERQKILFAGDITSTLDTRLTGDLSAQILKVAHHGSAYASSYSFLEQVRPLLAIIEVGKNSYGHPASSTLERISRVGARLLRTDREGTMRVTWDNGALVVSRVR
ncbi:MAG: MBL fold metallo-hydrolase [Candidatus Pacebacteria bacterium]|nr:MBL fold metallo-hydrolase [Candidatus Paceibacterota bacterium]